MTGPTTTADLLDGRYRMHELLGAGMFGTVHRAEHRVVGRTLRQVAVKVLDPRSVRHTAEALGEAVELFDLVERCADPRVRDRFVRCLDAGVERAGARRTYIVMELAAGNLAELTATDARQPPDRVLGIVRDLAEGLDYLHGHGTAHLDLKPDNVLLSPHRTIKIGDFGHARRLSETLRTASAGGALTYQPPEALTFGHFDASADVYATGLIAYQLLTGALPFGPELTCASGAAPDRGALAEIKRRPAPPPSTVDPELDGHLLDALVPRMLDPDPRTRIPDGTALLAELGGGGGGAGTGPPPRPPAEPPPPGHARWADELRQARLDGDRDRVAELARSLLAAIRDLRPPDTAPEAYEEIVNAHLARGDLPVAREIALEGVRRWPDRATRRAARRAFAGTPLADGFGEP